MTMITQEAVWKSDPAAGYTCSFCHKWHVRKEPYCCGCGAKMETDQKNKEDVT